MPPVRDGARRPCRRCGLESSDCVPAIVLSSIGADRASRPCRESRMRRIAGIAVLAGVCVAATMFAGAAGCRRTGRIGAAAAASEDGRSPHACGWTARSPSTRPARSIGYSSTRKLDGKLQSSIDKAVPHWVFLPPMVEGKPSAAKSHMRITLLGTKIAEGYDVRIDNVLFADTDTRDWDVPKEEKKAAEHGRDRMAPRCPSRRRCPGAVSEVLRQRHRDHRLNIAPDGGCWMPTPDAMQPLLRRRFLDERARRAGRWNKAPRTPSSNGGSPSTRTANRSRTNRCRPRCRWRTRCGPLRAGRVGIQRTRPVAHGIAHALPHARVAADRASRSAWARPMPSAANWCRRTRRCSCATANGVAL